jgi:hypothetical protein
MICLLAIPFWGDVALSAALVPPWWVALRMSPSLLWSVWCLPTSHPLSSLPISLPIWSTSPFCSGPVAARAFSSICASPSPCDSSHCFCPHCQFGLVCIGRFDGMFFFHVVAGLLRVARFASSFCNALLRIRGCAWGFK